MTAAAIVLLVAAGGCWLAAELHVLLHVLQQEHYEHARLRVWLAKQPRSRRRESALALAGLVLVAVAIVVVPAGGAAVALGMLVAAATALRAVWRRPQVKPLVFTPRARRLFGVALALGLPLPGVAPLIAHRLLQLADKLLVPVQKADNRRFVSRAREKLDAVSPLVVGITGSYGKTTTKACLAAVLDLTGPTYPTPASFNSYLGVVRAINEGLEPRHKAFVVEMGAYRVGDIRELCELVHPKVSVLTTIGPAHLERFGSLDVTEQAKGEIADALPEDGVFVTRADDERCLRVARTRTKARTVLFARAEHPDADVWAEDVRIERGRTVFALCVRSGDGVERAEVRARLLGDHNVANLLAAAAVGVALGLAPAEVARALGRVEPPAHRLQPIVNRASGVVVIDDSYNSNPEGAAAALGVLARHPAERRVLVTPGMVELGELEEQENRRLGELAAQACDRVVLIGGSRAKAIRQGLLDAGFSEDGIVLAPDAATAHKTVAETTRKGDVILFENDLPDVYVDGG